MRTRKGIGCRMLRGECPEGLGRSLAESRDFGES